MVVIRSCAKAILKNLIITLEFAKINSSESKIRGLEKGPLIQIGHYFVERY